MCFYSGEKGAPKAYTFVVLQFILLIYGATHLLTLSLSLSVCSNLNSLEVFKAISGRSVMVI